MTRLKLSPDVAALNNLPETVQVKSPAKYGNRKVTVGGIQFDSVRESQVYAELQLRERAGEIRDLTAHPRYPLEAYGVALGYYEGDFSFWDVAAGTPVVVDVKSQPTRTAVYRLKRKIFEAQYAPLTITEVE